MRPTQSRLPATRRTLDRRIVGTPEYVRNSIQRLQADRRLVHASPWREGPEGVTVTVRILEPVAPAPAPQIAVRPRRWPVAAAGTAGATVLGVGAYALIQLVNAVVAALPVIGGGLLLLALVALLTRARSSRTFTFTGTGRMD